MSPTKIEWANEVWNPVTGCTKVSEGCRNCYAETVVRRFGAKVHGYETLPDFDGTTERVCEPAAFSQVICHPDRLDKPLHWRKPRRIFVCSMGDLFHKYVPDEFIDQVFATMIMASQHTFMVLTKRPDRLLAYMETEERQYRWGYQINQKHGERPRPDDPRMFLRSNIWLGVSAEDQKTADERIPILLQTPAVVRFVSCEPMLGPVDFRWTPYHYQSTGETYREYLERKGRIDHLESLKQLDWVICGGESGPGARPMDIEWARSLKDQCVIAGVPYFLKQAHVDGKLVKMPELDGCVWGEYPNA